MPSHRTAEGEGREAEGERDGTERNRPPDRAAGCRPPSVREPPRSAAGLFRSVRFRSFFLFPFSFFLAGAAAVAGEEAPAAPADPPRPPAEAAVAPPPAAPLHELAEEEKKKLRELLDRFEAGKDWAAREPVAGEILASLGGGAAPEAAKRFEAAKDEALKTDLLRLLLRLENPAVMDTILAGLDGFGDDPPRGVIGDAVKFTDDRVGERIARWLSHPEADYIPGLLMVVQYQGSPKVLPPLFDLLAHPSWMVRGRALAAIVKFGGDRPGPAFEDALITGTKHRSEETRAAAVKIFELLGMREHSLRVRGFLLDSAPAVRRNAVEVLRFFKDRDSRNNVADLLRDPEPSVREAAAKALEELAAKEDRAIVVELVRVLAEETGREREALAAGNADLAKAAGKSRDAIAKALGKIVSEDLGTNPARWKIWVETTEPKPADGAAPPPEGAPPAEP